DSAVLDNSVVASDGTHHPHSIPHPPRSALWWGSRRVTLGGYSPPPWASSAFTPHVRPYGDHHFCLVVSGGARAGGRNDHSHRPPDCQHTVLCARFLSAPGASGYTGGVVY